MYVYVENGRGQGTVDTLTPSLSNLCEKKFLFLRSPHTLRSLLPCSSVLEAVNVGVNVV